MNDKKPLIDVKAAMIAAGAFLGARAGRIGAAAGALAGSLVSDRIMKFVEESPQSDSTQEPTGFATPTVSDDTGEKCDECGRMNKKESFYCVYCGKKIEKEE